MDDITGRSHLHPYQKKRITLGYGASVLPDYILAEIFLLLPVKCLLRFGSVCKSWCTLLSDRSFVYLHLTRATQNKDNFSLFIQLGKVSCHLPAPINFHLPTQLLRKNSLPTLHDNGRARLICSCNGLLFFSDRHYEHLYLVNPSTRSYSPLPNPYRYVNTDPAYKPCYDRVLAFGYNAFTGEYKAIQIVYYHKDKQVDFKMTEVHVHTLGSNSWRVRTRVHIPGFIHFLSPVTSFNGSLHWLTTYDIFGSTLPVIIVAFDVESEKIVPLLLPSNFAADCNCANNSKKCHVSVFEGCLCVFQNNIQKKCVEVWEMKEYGVGDSWTQKYSIRHPSIVSSLRFCKPLRFFQNGEILLQTARNPVVYNNLIVYNPRSESARSMLLRNEISGEAILGSTQIIDYVDSLVRVKGLWIDNTLMLCDE